MADAIVSAVAEQIVGLIAEQARFHINLVRGAEKEVLQLSDELKAIRSVLDDAENRRFKNDMVNKWLYRLEHTSREMEDVLEEWNYAIVKLEMESDDAVVADPTPPKQKSVCSFIPSSSCLCFKKVVVRHDIAKKILNVKAKLDQVLKENDRYNFVRSQPTAETSHMSWRVPSISFTNLVEVQGRDSDRDILVTKLLGKQEELGSIHVVSIVGVGGLGKTTLAQLVYGDSRVEKFFDLRIWVCVSDPFDLAAIAKGIIESVTKGDSPNTNNLETLLQSVRDSITGKKFLLVLDDVWTEDSTKWDPLKTSLKCGGMGSKILVTTRNENVAKITGTVDNDIHRPGKLSDEDSWLLLRQIAQPGMEFEEIGKKIAKKCDGLPLAVKTLGSVLRFKKTLEEWENVLESEVWQLEEAKTDLFRHLLLSYNELSPTLKRCFSYCAVFPKDFEINVESLIGYWMALGYLGSGNMELKGQECFDILATRSLFQDFKKNNLDEKIRSCKMHDIVHDFAQFLRKSGKVEATGMNKTSCEACDPLLVSTVNEFCSLFVSEEESPQNLCGCLKRLRVLSMRGSKSIPRGIENMIQLRWLYLFNIDESSSAALKFIFQLYNLQTLCLVLCKLEEIPREVKNLTQLRHLDLSWNESLKELPREIGNLIQLRHLDLRKNGYLKELPREIGNLIQLRHLDLSWNKSLKELPREIGNLIQLRHLDLRNNGYLKELPREIGNLIQLRHLDLSWNGYLKELPREIGNLIQLRHLYLSNNGSLKELPREIGNLTQLRHLVLSWNKSLKELPREIGNLTQLRHLVLSWNESLKELPREIGNLIQLRHLDLSENKSLKELPREIGNLIQLRHLDLSRNESLKELPREIGNLIQLRHLDLSRNESLKELPREIGNLIQLRHLDLSWNKSLKELPREIGNLIQLRHLELRENESLKELPREIENLIQLRHLDLSQNKSLKVPREIGNLIQLRHLDLHDIESLKELPREIGNLIELRHLDLNWNKSLEELPREIGNLIQLRHLDLSGNIYLKELPESICGLHELQTLDVFACSSLSKLPEGVGQLTGLHRLGEFHGGNGWNKLGLLNKLNHLSGYLILRIRLANCNLEQVVEDAREAELRNKTDINSLDIRFVDEMDESDEASLVRMNVIDALEPHPNLTSLTIRYYKGPKLPLSWIVSPLNQLRRIILFECNHLSSLPPLGKLPCLEEIYISNMEGLEFVGREFLGIDMELDIIAFPKLKELTFENCRNWKEWEDITSEEESADMTLMPCLLNLKILYCQSLTMLPHGLLHRVASSLESLDISNSTLLVQRYRDEDDSDWNYISQYNPRLQLKR